MKSSMHRIYSLVGAAALGLLLAACGSAEVDKDDTPEDASIVAVEVTGEGEVEKFDLNGDGKPDVWKLYTIIGGAPAVTDEEAQNEAAIDPGEKERLLARSEMDVNFDGKVDMRQLFNKDGAMIREEMDLDFDGNQDAIDHYRDGKITKREIYAGFSKQVSMWKHYEDGALIRKERDTTKDGKPDTFEYFENGVIQRIGLDQNGDGKPDYYEVAKTEEE
jgi:hypothetical protein